MNTGRPTESGSVAVLVVSYNSEKFIQQTIESCLAQTFANFKIFVFDNGSTDTTLNILQNLPQDRLQVFRSTKNIGPYAALNRLLDVTHGYDYIAIQDHDDLWLSEKLSRQVEWLVEHPSYVGCGTLTYYFYEDRRCATLSRIRETTKSVDHSSLMFRQTSLRYNPLYPSPDELFIHSLQTKAPLGCVQNALTIHRLRGDKKNLSTRRTRFNLRGALAHVRLRGLSYLPSALMYVVGSVIPSSILWWIRRNLTLRNAQWFDERELNHRTGIHIN